MAFARISRFGDHLGRGLLAGAVGTAAMTVSSTIEMKLRGRAPSSAPADAAAKVLGVEPQSARDKQRFSNLVHAGYGTGWGAIRGVLGFLGLGPVAASAVHLALVWGTEQATLPRLGVTPPVREWGAKEIAIDGWHHLVYASATGAVYELLSTPRPLAS